MSDLGPLDRCKVGKRGRHRLVFFSPETTEGDITAICERCGSTRRMPASGDFPVLDDMDVDKIMEAARRASA